MTEACQADEFALEGYGRGGSGKCVLGNAGAKNPKRALEADGLSAGIARYQAVSNLVQKRP
jgi:hypothetical protein